MEDIKNTLTTIENHVATHRAKYATAVTAITAFALSRRAVKQWNEFLEEKGLLDEFYLPEMVSEK